MLQIQPKTKTLHKLLSLQLNLTRTLTLVVCCMRMCTPLPTLIRKSSPFAPQPTCAPSTALCLSSSISKRRSTAPTEKSSNTTRPNTLFKCQSQILFYPVKSPAQRKKLKLNGNSSVKSVAFHLARSADVSSSTLFKTTGCQDGAKAVSSISQKVMIGSKKRRRVTSRPA